MKAAATALLVCLALPALAQEVELDPELEKFLLGVMTDQSQPSLADEADPAFVDDGISLTVQPRIPTDQRVLAEMPPPPPIAVTDARGGILRGLDRSANKTEDMTIEDGQSARIGDLTVSLSDCRYPSDNPSSDAFAHVTITDSGGAALFDGWMVASSPALSALDHPRYDIWVLNCISPEG